ncbi:MAG: thioredoxin [Candidatus Syntrophoarchaeum sp. WYZ-LMO15]|nr:MAG: thioredoxin [Candidatus Syntrophoarchaeum sp. WYZ-LMO15]
MINTPPDIYRRMLKAKRALMLLVTLSIPLLIQLASSAPIIEIHYFYGEDCPHCQALSTLLDKIEEEYPNVKIYRYEVYYNETNGALFDEFRKRYGIKVGGVPVLFFNDTYLSGDITEADIKAEIARLEAGDEVSSRGEEVSPSFIIISGIVNGIINLCTFAVLILLLTSLLTLNDRRRVLIIGFSFIIAVYLTYLLVGLGIINTFAFAGMNSNLRVVVIVIALLAGVINIRDYFTGQSTLAIPGFAKPKIKDMVRYATIPAAGLLGVFATLIGLPCTVGVYLPILSVLSGKTMLCALLYLMLYNLLYTLPLIGILAFVYFGTDPGVLNEMRKEKKRYIRLFGGIAMLIIGLLMLLGVV